MASETEAEEGTDRGGGTEAGEVLRGIRQCFLQKGKFVMSFEE